MPYGGDNNISWEEGSANTKFAAVFYDAGFYILRANCTVTIHSTADGSAIGTLNAKGYIGGDATDISGSGGSSAEKVSGDWPAGDGLSRSRLTVRRPAIRLPRPQAGTAGPLA